MIEEYIQEAIGFYTQASVRLEKNLASTSEDRLHWSPSATARSPLAIAVHCGLAVKGMTKSLKGVEEPSPEMSPADMDNWLREQEKAVTTRDQALALLHEANDEHISWLRTITPDVLSGTTNLGFGPMPTKLVIHIVAGHLHDHAAQIEYIQTIYGDREWRM